MLLIRNAEPLPRVDRLHSENPHQMSGLMASHVISPPFQRPAHPPAPVIRKIQINPVHLLENVPILLAQSGRLVVKRGPVKIKYLALTPDAQFLMILLHKLSFHRFWSCLYFFYETPARYSVGRSFCITPRPASPDLRSADPFSSKRHPSHFPATAFSTG